MDVVKDPQFWTQLVAIVGVMWFLMRQLGARIDSRFDAVDSRFDAVDARFGAVDAKLGAIDQRFAHLEQVMDERFAHQDAVMVERFAHQAAMMDVRFASLEHRVGALEGDMKLVKAHLIPPAA